ncbi:hypothetical protein E1258_00100 [Micromonospora sp. KC207]|uniref:hypothetical protein n=1 Tax=Micromonospora sp. KC207 TaxID=2530377 RepID=UPI001043D705|nr:hypothetical protein [Micromonospora sp. KC207]TDC67332.1 hypothetical protein E1258_00100 [Micromonospora sp. KC207]
MRDDLTFAERMHRDLRNVRWPEPADIRARARRRSRRTAMAAAAAVLAVLSVFAVAVGGRAGGHLAPPMSWVDGWRASTEPEPSGRTEIGQEALLDPADLGVPSNVRLGDSGLQEQVRVDPLLQSCAVSKEPGAGPPVSRYSRSQTLLLDDTSGQDGPMAVPVLTQDVYRLDPAPAGRLLADLDRAATTCARWSDTAVRPLDDGHGTVPVAHTWQTVARDFAGDEAVVLRHTVTSPVDATTGKPLDVEHPPETRMIVRVGDLVTVIVPERGLGVDGPDGPRETSDAELLELGRTAARRMCLAANPAC